MLRCWNVTKVDSTVLQRSHLILKWIFSDLNFTCILFCFVCLFCSNFCVQDIFSGSTHLSDSSTLILERVDRHHAGVYQCAADNGVREPVSMDINLTILCEFCSMTVDKFPLNCHIPICVCVCDFFFVDCLFVSWFCVFVFPLPCTQPEIGCCFIWVRFFHVCPFVCLFCYWFLSLYFIICKWSVLCPIFFAECALRTLMQRNEVHSIWMSLKSRAHGIVRIFRVPKIWWTT